MELVIDAVGKRYGRSVWGLRDFSLTLRPGVVGLLGPNGAGKSTLMRIIATVTRPTVGRVTWNGTDLARDPDAVRRVLGYLPQDFGVYPNLSALEFLEYLAAAKGLDARHARTRIAGLLELVNLTEVARRPLGGFSGGMRQRVGIAQALLNDPRLLIVDEPTAGLDPEERMRFRNLLSELSGERIVILSTHIVSDVEAVATHIAMIAQGRLVAHDSPEALLRAAAGRAWEWVIPSDALAAVKAAHRVSGTMRRGDGVHVRIVSDVSPGPGARPAEVTLEVAYLWSIGGSRSRGAAGSLAAGRPGALMVVRVLFQLVRADFLERVRRHSFLVTLGFTILAAYMFLPPNHARYSTLHFSGHRGIYNSAWVGSVIAMLSATFLGLAGFYLVKNAIERDRRTGVGQILAATPLSKALYLLGKLTSNFAVLGVMVIVLAAAAGVMQLVRGEDMHLQPLALVSPFVILTLPAMALVAALAVAFEATPGLRGGLGNVVYFFIWMTGLSLTAAIRNGGLPDPVGGEMLIHQMHAACAAAFPDFPSGRGMSMGFNIKAEGVWDLRTFAWGGATWTPAMLASRAAWVGVAVALVLMAALWFDRFDAHAVKGRLGGGRRAARAPRDQVGVEGTEIGAGDPLAAAALALPGGSALARGVADIFGTRVQPGARPAPGRLRLGGLALAEIRIMLKGFSRWWYLVVLGLVILGLFVPLPGVKQFVAPIALIWPLLLWSPMGSREHRHRTDALLFSTPRPVTGLLVAQWLAGALIALVVTGGALVRFGLSGEWSSLAALLVAAAFIPSMALALGTWSRSAKLFEVVYLMLWYGGPLNQVPALDFVGVTQPGSGTGPIVVFLFLAVGLAVLAWLGRLRQLAR